MPSAVEWPTPKSVRGQILAGFGTIILLSLISSAVNLVSLSAIDRGCEAPLSGLDKKAAKVEIDLVMTKARVRVNQWLRGFNPAFAAQASESLAQNVLRVRKVGQSAHSLREKEVVSTIAKTFDTYFESWRVVQQLYAEQLTAPIHEISRQVAQSSLVTPDAVKGFAAVASEVKNHARQTANAEEEIGAQVA